MFEPIVQELPADLDPIVALKKLQHLPYPCLLHSTLAHASLGRYSFLSADPLEVFRLLRPTADPLAKLSNMLKNLPKTKQIDALPPFQGGVMGLLSYDLGMCFERLPRPQHNEFEYPLALFGLYDIVIAWDHVLHRTWLISQGLCEGDEAQRSRHAQHRINQFLKLLDAPARRSTNGFEVGPHATAHGLTAPQFETRLAKEWIGSFDSAGVQNYVRRVRDYIRNGDVFQVNIAQRLIRPAECDSVALYEALSRSSPAPFAGYFDGGEFQIASSSPERFLKVDEHRWVETRPIKGTRRRGASDAEDASLREELRQSPKDCAENTMIVDLLRNDLSRVCEVDSISVPKLCQIETYSQVHHLVSVIRGKLRAGVDITDLIAATFPGGSITGAPKVRAMEIIAELEPTARGPYCGGMGYIGLNGTSDWNILIRTILAKAGWWQFNVGGGILWDSDVLQEEEETWVKARGMLAAIDGVSALSTNKTQ